MWCKELGELFYGMDDAKLLELLVADQVAESSQIDLCVFQQLVSRQHLLVGIQFGRFVQRLEEGKQFIFGWDTVRCVVLYLLPDVVDDLLFSVGGQKVQQLLFALFKWIHDYVRFVFR